MTTNGFIQHTSWEISASLPPIPITDILKADGSLACRIEHYVDYAPETAQCILQFRDRMALIYQDAPHYATIGLDSTSFLQDAAVNYQKLVTPYTMLGNVDPRKWYANAKEDVKRELISRLAWMRDQYVVLLCHASEKTSEFSDEIVRNISAIGQLPKDLGRSFAEVYRAYVRDEMDQANRPTGRRQYLLQTQQGMGWGAMSLIEAPNPCWNHFDALWTGKTTTSRPTRCIIYGDFGTGKSLMLSTFPQPMLLFAFDPIDKLIHYERLAGT